MTEPLLCNSRWRVIRGPKAGHILIVGRPAGRSKYPSKQVYWVMDTTENAKGKVMRKVLEQECEPIL